uniref:Small ribosomal subunit protein uS17c n=1 Tax=Boldia erythrosiphon TaxID=74908 RepID=A0A1Y9TLU9_9RHOD|nr:30S ribosomal protein S17 [Boldia erythrosiphon]ARO90590.1 30S ribosomal protein S17 [Boldia erythrosiphon]
MSIKEKIGKVISNKMDKTIVVSIENRVPHPKYKKILLRTKKYKAHDENNDCRIGDIVKIKQTRPLSRTKFWRMSSIISR